LHRFGIPRGWNRPLRPAAVTKPTWCAATLARHARPAEDGAHKGGDSLMYDVVIEVSGKEHTGKTSIIAAISTRLEELGVKVILQRIDPQLDDKLTMDQTVLERLKSTTVFIREMQTPL
jgi:hypothetical protein